MKKSQPLFVPLRAEFFRAFAAGSKTVEWRKFGPRFNERTLWAGRAVTLSNGYSGQRLHGHIVQCEFLQSRLAGPAAIAIYGPDAILIGIHIRLADFTPRARPR